MSDAISSRPIAKIKIGQRHRHYHGDIDGLAQNIAEIGLLHPIVIWPDGRLIAGARRLRAFKRLKRDRIPVTVIDLEKVVLGEYAENVFRKAFTPSEMVEIADDIEPLQMLDAKKRQLAGKGEDGSGGRGKKKNPTGNSHKVSRAPTAMDRVARVVGKDRRTLEKARAVVRAAKAEPEKFGVLKEDMDASGNVDRAFKELQIKKERANYEARADRGANVGDLIAMAKAGKKFQCILADPGWEFKVYSGKGKQRSAERHYDTSSLEAIKALPVAPLAANDCALFLWCVMPELPGALEVIKAWSFEFKTAAFVWAKKSRDGLFTGLGHWTRANVELCLFATRGNPQRINKDVHQVVMAPVGEHSAKPDEVRRRIERLLNGPYLELFARKPVEGWTVWSNEVAPLTDAVSEAAE